MKKYFLLAFVLTILFPCFLTAAPGGAVSLDVQKSFKDAGLPVQSRRISPIDFTLPLLNTGSQKLSALKGKVVFLNFWATWCGPCRLEMPSMENLYSRFKDQGLEILAVNSGEGRNDVASFMKSNKLNFPAALDESGAISRQYGVQAIPTTFIIDREGEIISRVVGSLDWNNPKIIAAFEMLLKN
jgi:thiol-disulfide isomerase/thioredoxin